MSDNDINSSASALQIPSNAGGTESVKDLIKEVRSALISFFQVGKFEQKKYFSQFQFRPVLVFQQHYTNWVQAYASYWFIRPTNENY